MLQGFFLTKVDDAVQQDIDVIFLITMKNWSEISSKNN